MLFNKKLDNKNNLTYIFFLTIFSVLLNQYYGYQGILPIDSFLIFNSGYDLLNGNLPFKDYWTIKEPFIDLLQAVFFKFFGVSWFSYVFHASVFNFLITLSTYLILKNLNLNINYCFIYSICVAILTYPTTGTPFSDHHALILSILSLYLFFYTLKKPKNLYWFFIPFLLGFAFLSKQAPTSYFILIISFFSIIYFISQKKNFNFIFSFFGFVSFIILFIFTIFIGKINFYDFLNQYILFPQSLGGDRLDWVFPLEFKRVVWRFKLLYLAISILLIVYIKEFLKDKKNILKVDLLIMGSLIFCCLALIFHQLMTINSIFIYCIIPIFCGFSHVYYKTYFNKKYLNYFLLLLTITSTIYYFINYVNNRTFMDLRNVNLKNSVDGELVDKRFSGIKWITMFYPDNPIKEVEKIKFAVNQIKKEKQKKMIITDYQFISVFLEQYDYAVTRFWYDYHGYPSANSKYFEYWKNFVLRNIRTNEIKVIYVLMPLHGDTKPLENVLTGCFKKEAISPKLYKLKLNNC